MRTIRTGSGEGTTAVARKVDAGLGVGVADGDGAEMGDAEEDATAADAEARSRATWKASRWAFDGSAAGCIAVSTIRAVSATPMRAAQQARTRARLMR
jgi:hypothetical protein